jgi:hypothetical protein
MCTLQGDSDRQGQLTVVGRSHRENGSLPEKAENELLASLLIELVTTFPMVHLHVLISSCKAHDQGTWHL